MKKITSVFLIAALLLSILLTACQKQSTENSANSPLANDFSITMEDSSGEKFVLTGNEIYYRFYLNIWRSAILSQNWQNANEIEPEYLTNFFTSQTNWNQTTYEDIDLPGKFLEPYIQRYFNVQANHLKKSISYSVSEDTYRLSIYPTEPISKVTDASAVDNILTIHYETYKWDEADNAAIEAEGILRLEIEAYPGYFHYLSNECNPTA